MAHVFEHLQILGAGTPLGDHIGEEQTGLAKGYVHCHSCGYVSERDEPFTALPLPIKGRKNLQEALLGYTSPELMQGDNQYRCSSCGQLSDASKGQYFDQSRLPKIFTIQLGRFEFDMRTLSRKKISDELPFPLILDVAEYCKKPGLVGDGTDDEAKEDQAVGGDPSSEPAGASDVPQKKAPDVERSTRYALFAVMMHLGGTHGGHYFAYIRD